MPRTSRGRHSHRTRRPTDSPPPSSPRQVRTRNEPPPQETIDDDDICHICCLLLLRPVRTTCSHIFCESCFSQWADVSTQQMMTGLSIDDTTTLPPHEIEARCPMCRTSTVARIDRGRIQALTAKYPATYAARGQEVALGEEDEDGLVIEPVTIYIGNEHKLRRHETDEDRNRHEWHFFVRASRTDIIEEVQVFLHPTFRQHKVVLQWPPYSIRRIGWGVFTIYVNVVLKGGYSWVSPEAEDTSDGARKGKLPLEWRLDFDGRGSQGRLRLKVRREKDGHDSEEERETERTRRLWMQQRERDPDFVPPPEH